MIDSIWSCSRLYSLKKEDDWKVDFMFCRSFSLNAWTNHSPETLSELAGNSMRKRWTVCHVKETCCTSNSGTVNIRTICTDSNKNPGFFVFILVNPADPPNPPDTVTVWTHQTCFRRVGTRLDSGRWQSDKGFKIWRKHLSDGLTRLVMAKNVISYLDGDE